jgi:hypothetical protein
MQVIVRNYGDFDDFMWFWAAKNKANSKPILFSPQHCWGLETNLKKQSQFEGLVTFGVLVGNDWI